MNQAAKLGESRGSRVNAGGAVGLGLRERAGLADGWVDGVVRARRLRGDAAAGGWAAAGSTSRKIASASGCDITRGTG